MKFSKVYIFLMIVLFISVWAMALNAPKSVQNTKPTITVNTMSIVQNDSVTVSDIANLENFNDAQTNLLKSIEVETAPPVGRQKIICKELLLARLNKGGFNPKDINLVIPNSIVIKRDSKNVDLEDLKKEIENTLISQLSYPADKVIFNDYRLPQEIIIPQGNVVTYEITVRNRNSIAGLTQLGIGIYVDGKMVKQTFGTVRVDAKINIVKAKKDIQRNVEITADMLKVLEGRLSTAPRNFSSDLSDVIGKRATRSIRADDVITTQMIAKPLLVTRNTNVLMIAEKDGLHITAMGKSKQEGGKGDMIAVVNTTSEKEVLGEVIDKNTVRIQF